MVNHFTGQQGAAQGLLRQVAVSQHPLPTLRVTDIGVDLTLFNALPSSPLLGQHLHFLPREVPNLLSYSQKLKQVLPFTVLTVLQ